MHDPHLLPTNTGINCVHNRLLSTLNTHITNILSFFVPLFLNKTSQCGGWLLPFFLYVTVSFSHPPSSGPVLHWKHITHFFKHFQTATLCETFPRAPIGLSPQPYVHDCEHFCAFHICFHMSTIFLLLLFSLFFFLRPTFQCHVSDSPTSQLQFILMSLLVLISKIEQV